MSDFLNKGINNLLKEENNQNIQLSTQINNIEDIDIPQSNFGDDIKPNVKTNYIPDALSLEYPKLAPQIRNAIIHGADRKKIQQSLMQAQFEALKYYTPEQINAFLGRTAETHNALFKYLDEMQTQNIIDIMKYDMPEEQVRDRLKTASLTGISPSLLLFKPDPKLLKAAEEAAGIRANTLQYLYSKLKRMFGNVQQSNANSYRQQAQEIKNIMNDENELLEEGKRNLGVMPEFAWEMPSDETLKNMGVKSYNEQIKKLEEYAKTDEADAASWYKNTNIRPPDSAILAAFGSAIENSGFTIKSWLRSAGAWYAGGPFLGLFASLYNSLDESQIEAGEVFANALQMGKTPEEAFEASRQVRIRNLFFLPASNYGGDYLLVGPATKIVERVAENLIPGGGLISKLARGTIKYGIPALGSSLIEGNEELVQEVFQLSALGENLDTEQNQDRIWEAAKMGTLDSFIFSLFGLTAQSVKQKISGNTAQEVLQNIANNPDIQQIISIAKQIQQGNLNPDDTVREDNFVFIPENALNDETKKNLGITDEITDDAEEEFNQPLSFQPETEQTNEQSQNDASELIAIPKNKWEDFTNKNPEVAQQIQEQIEERTIPVTAKEDLAEKIQNLKEKLNPNENPQIKAIQEKTKQEIIDAGRPEEEAQLLSDIVGRVAYAIFKNYNNNNVSLEQIANITWRNGINKTQKAGENYNQLIGEKGGARLNLFADVARKMQQSGKDPKSIFHATGWWQEPTGEWVYDLPDGELDTNHIMKEFKSHGINRWNAKTGVRWYSLEKVYKSQDLYKAYPELKNVKLDIVKKVDKNGYSGLYDPNTKTIKVKSTLSYKVMRLAMIHEIQHAVQDIEGFLEGPTPDMFDNDMKIYSKKHDDITKQIKDLDRKNNIPLRNSKNLDIEALRKNSPDAKEYQRLQREDRDNENEILKKYGGSKNRDEVYWRSFHEAQAFNAEDRANLTNEQRSQLSPGETMSYPSDQILIDRRDNTPKNRTTFNQTSTNNVTPEDVSQLKKAYDKVRAALTSDTPFIRIYNVRKEIGWEREKFDRVLSTLWDKWIVNLYQADATIMTDEEIEGSFIDYTNPDNPWRLGIMLWNDEEATTGEKYKVLDYKTPRNSDEMYPVYETLPEGWKIDESSSTAPKGYVWINTDESFLANKRKSGFITEEEYKKIKNSDNQSEETLEAEKSIPPSVENDNLNPAPEITETIENLTTQKNNQKELNENIEEKIENDNNQIEEAEEIEKTEEETAEPIEPIENVPAFENTESVEEITESTEEITENVQNVEDNNKIKANASWEEGKNFTEAETLINFFATADASSGFHELGHHILRVLTDLSKMEGSDPQLQEDINTIFENAGITREQWDNDIDNAKEKAQEYFAKAFETYLMEGKAPTKKLQGAFDRIKELLIKIYRYVVQDLGIELNDEMRDVFNRILSTPGQVETEKTMDELEIIEEATQNAIQKTEERIQELEQQEINVPQIDNDEYTEYEPPTNDLQVQDFFKQLENFYVNSDNIKYIKDVIKAIKQQGGLIFKEISNVLGNKNLAQDIRKKFPGLLKSKGGIELDIMQQQLEALGYSDLGNIVDWLLNVSNKKIKAPFPLVEITNDTFQELMNNLGPDETKKYITLRKNFIEKEIKQLNKKGIALNEAHEKTGDKQYLDDLTINDFDLKQFRDEQKIIKDSLKTINDIFERNNNEEETEIPLPAWFKRVGNEETPIYDAIKQAINNGFKVFEDYARLSYKAGVENEHQKLKRQAKAMKERQAERKKIKAERSKMLNSIKYMSESKNILWNNQQEIKDLLSQYDRQQFRNMSFADVWGLYEKIRSTYVDGREKLAAKKAIKDQQNENARNELRSTMPGYSNKNKGVVRNRSETGKQYKGIKGETEKILDWAHAKTLGAIRFFDWLDGRKGFKGIWQEIFVDRTNKARNSELKQTFRRSANLEAKMLELGLNPKDLTKTRFSANIVPTLNGTDWTVDQLMSLYAGMQNEKSRNAILYGNFAGQENPETLVATAIEALTENEKALADFIIQEYEDNFDRINQAFIYIENIGMQHEERYTPMRRIEYTTKQNNINPDAAQSGNSGMGNVEKGFTKSRAEYGEKQQPGIDLGLVDIWKSQVAAQEHYVAFAEHVKDLRSILLGRRNGNPSIRQMVKEVHGNYAWDMIKKYFNIIANDDFQNSHDILDGLSRYMGRNMSIAYLVGNVGTMIKQIGSFFLALPYAGPVSMLNTIGQFLNGRENFLEECYNLDPQLRDRRGDPFLRAMRENENGVYQSLLTLGLEPIGWFDRATSAIVFKATYDTNIKQGLSHDDAIKEAQKAVLLTQPPTNIKDKPLVWQQHGYAKLLMMFTNSLSNIWGMTIYDLSSAIKNKNTPAFMYTLTGLALAATLIKMINSGPPDDWDNPDEWAKFIASAFTEQEVNSIPLIGKGALALWNAKSGYFTQTDPFLAPFSKMLHGFQRLGDKKTENDEQAISNLLDAIALLTPFPATAIRRIAQTIKYAGEGEVLKALKAMIGMRNQDKKLRKTSGM